MRADPGPAAIPRAAATLVILRDGPHAMEVLLTKRPEHMRFMGGATVFPGGALHDGDLDPRWDAAVDITPATAKARMDEDDDRVALGLHVCVLREAFEEVGFIVTTSGPDPDRAAAHDDDTFLDSCLRRGAVLAASSLVPGGRWVTPLGAPVRFDTRFFLARAPAGWEPLPDAAEVAGCWWTTPARALTDLASGTIAMAPPTIEMLQHLDGHHDAESTLAAFATGEAVGGGDILSIKLSPLVHVVLAPNPGVMTGPGTNTYIVGRNPTIVIDPAVAEKSYVDALAAAAGDVAAIAITHRHPDHTGGITALRARVGDVPVRAHGGDPAGGVAVDPVRDGEVLEAGGARLVALHTPGHASDHLCFLLDGAATLFAGDSVLGEGTAVIAPPDGDMKAYMASLARLRELHIDRIFPGHFRPLDGGAAVIDDYIAHRKHRETLILEAVGSSATVEEIVARAYADTPEHLHPVARYSAVAHLEMLKAGGVLEQRGDRWIRRDGGQST